jgi:hypothetical protein
MKWVSIDEQLHTSLRSPCAIPSVSCSGRYWTQEQYLEWWITLHHIEVQQTNLGLADARRTLPAWMHSAICKVWWRRNNGLGLFTMTFSTVLWFQLCGNSLGKALSCFSMTMPQCTNRSPYQNGLSWLLWGNLTGLHRALTSTPSNTFVRNWNPCSNVHLVESLCRRVEAVIAAKWEPTPY